MHKQSSYLESFLQILPSSNCVSITEWLHYLDANKTPWKKARQELPKNSVCCFEQILEAASYKKATVWQLTSHHTNYPVRQAIHARHCWRSKDELISDVFLWTPTHGHTSIDWPAKTCIYELSANARSCLEDLPCVMIGLVWFGFFVLRAYQASWVI